MLAQRHRYKCRTRQTRFQLRGLYCFFGCSPQKKPNSIPARDTRCIDTSPCAVVLRDDSRSRRIRDSRGEFLTTARILSPGRTIGRRHFQREDRFFVFTDRPTHNAFRSRSTSPRLPPLSHFLLVSFSPSFLLLFHRVPPYFSFSSKNALELCRKIFSSFRATRKPLSFILTESLRDMSFFLFRVPRTLLQSKLLLVHFGKLDLQMCQK